MPAASCKGGCGAACAGRHSARPRARMGNVGVMLHLLYENAAPGGFDSLRREGFAAKV
ncbi:hypothetical protein D3C77_719840 [compost metagenome]